MSQLAYHYALSVIMLRVEIKPLSVAMIVVVMLSVLAPQGDRLARILAYLQLRNLVTNHAEFLQNLKTTYEHSKPH